MLSYTSSKQRVSTSMKRKQVFKGEYSKQCYGVKVQSIEGGF